MRLIIPILIFFFFSFNVYSDQTDHRLKNLFRILAKSNNNIEIDRTITNIWNIWHETNDPKINQVSTFDVSLDRDNQNQLESQFDFLEDLIKNFTKANFLDNIACNIFIILFNKKKQ